MHKIEIRSFSYIFHKESNILQFSHKSDTPLLTKFRRAKFNHVICVLRFNVHFYTKSAATFNGNSAHTNFERIEFAELTECLLTMLSSLGRFFHSYCYSHIPCYPFIVIMVKYRFI